MTDLILDSLRRRMRAMHSLWEQAVATMDLDQVNHVEREPVLPIAFSLFHFVQIEDGSATMLGAGADGLRRSVGARGWASPSTTTASTGRSTRWSHQRIGDYDAFQRVHATRVREDRVVARRARPGRRSPRSSCRDRSRPRSRPPTAPGSRERRASPASTPPSAGSTSTACATWARSSTPAPWSASRA